MAEAGVQSMQAITAEGMSVEASLDLAEELFVSCRFTEAARVCTDALNLSSIASTSSNPGGASNEQAIAVPAVTFGEHSISPVEECDIPDLIVAVLLQCGFELRRAEEWNRCGAFYRRERGGAMPFSVGVLWLRLRLARGEIDLVHGVLWQLRAALGEDLHRAATAIASPAAESDKTARANYFETMEMLVVQTLLSSTDWAEASSLVSSDLHLGHNERKQLLKACALTASQAGEPELGAAGGEGRPSLSRRSNRGSAQAPRGAQGSGHAAPDNREHPPMNERQGHQGPVQKLFSNVSGLTPEGRVQLVMGVGAAGLAVYAACRNRESLWRAARNAAQLAGRTAGDVGTFVVGSS